MSDLSDHYPTIINDYGEQTIECAEPTCLAGPYDWWETHAPLMTAAPPAAPPEEAYRKGWTDGYYAAAPPAAPLDVATLAEAIHKGMNTIGCMGAFHNCINRSQHEHSARIALAALTGGLSDE